jgi:hypothetical protein
MTKVLGMIMSVGMLVALAGCAATDKGGVQGQVSEQPAAAKVSAEGEKAGCTKPKSCCAKEQGTCPKEKAACDKPCDKK